LQSTEVLVSRERSADTAWPEAPEFAFLPALAGLQDCTALAAAHSFSSFSNWVVPGWLMAGRYVAYVHSFLVVQSSFLRAHPRMYMMWEL
jgi:hypothetical protein